MTDISSRTDLAVESFPGGKGLPREAEYSAENTGSFTIERMKLSKESGKARHSASPRETIRRSASERSAS